MSTEQEMPRTSHVHNFTNDNTDEDDYEEDEPEGIEEEEDEQEERSSGRDCNILYGACWRRPSGWSLGQVLDPRSKWVQEWSRVFLLVCATGLFVDPLFFYALSISDTCMCLFVDGWFAITVTVLRCMTDVLHVWNIWLSLKTAKLHFSPHAASVSSRASGGGRGKLHDASQRAVSLQYLKARKGLFFDLFVILPLPQVVLWVALPSQLERGETTRVMTVLLIVFLFQYLPKIYHFVCLLRRMQNLSGYIFGTVWWGIALNMIAYFVASHAAGACWYLLGIQRAAKCLKEQCRSTDGCFPRVLASKEPIYYGTTTMVQDRARLAWCENRQARSMCLDASNNYDYGAYKWTLQLVTNDSRLEKILFPIFWGLMTLSTFGTLESTTEWLEVVFNIFVLTSGLLLVTMLIGNIKVFCMQRHLRSSNATKDEEHRMHWAAMRGVDECQMIQNLPEGLRRDIKYHLCSDLVRQVPLFQHMDDLCLENICDRVKSLIFTKGETITREGRGCEVRDATLPVHVPERESEAERTVLLPLDGGHGPPWRSSLRGRRYKHRLTLTSLSFIRPRRPLSRCSSLGEDRIRLYTALLTSPKPNQDDFDFDETHKISNNIMLA
ncbi:Cyclic nucleotide-binding domain-containing protein [Psidium guajava]|nr:Cyclic nucleotide-binding domain-containing protein [Psidium guajava]